MSSALEKVFVCLTFFWSIHVHSNRSLVGILDTVISGPPLFNLTTSPTLMSEGGGGGGITRYKINPILNAILNAIAKKIVLFTIY